MQIFVDYYFFFKYCSYHAEILHSRVWCLAAVSDEIWYGYDHYQWVRV